MTSTDNRNIVQKTLVKHTAYARGWSRLSQCFKYAEESAEPICLAVLGESRTGKSRLLEEFERTHPTVRKADGLEVPVLRVKTPSKPTVKGLAERLLEKIGDPDWHKDSESKKTVRLRRLLDETKTRLLIVDEFQQFRDAVSDKVAHHVADWMKILVDDSHRALVVAGLPTCRSIINQNEQLAGRFLGEVTMPRFEWTDDDDRDEFCGILEGFHTNLATKFEVLDLEDEEIAFRFYCATGGLIGYLTKCLQQAVWDAVDERRKIITLRHLKSAHENSIWQKTRLEGLLNPFDPKFRAVPTPDLLARVATIGTRKDEPSPPKRNRRRAGALDQASSPV